MVSHNMSPEGEKISREYRHDRRRRNVLNAALITGALLFLVFAVYVIATIQEARSASAERDQVIAIMQEDLKTVCQQTERAKLTNDNKQRCARAERDEPPPEVQVIQGQEGPRGSAGPTGPRGFRGQEGPRGQAGVGRPGPVGAPGTSGPRGEQGPKGDKGDQGDPCDPEANPACRGPQGDKGGQGDPGGKGDTGERGPRGFFVVDARLEQRDEGCLLIFIMNDESGTEHTVEVPGRFCVPPPEEEG